MAQGGDKMQQSSVCFPSEEAGLLTAFPHNHVASAPRPHVMALIPAEPQDQGWGASRAADP